MVLCFLQVGLDLRPDLLILDSQLLILLDLPVDAILKILEPGDEDLLALFTLAEHIDLYLQVLQIFQAVQLMLYLRVDLLEAVDLVAQLLLIFF